MKANYFYTGVKNLNNIFFEENSIIEKSTALIQDFNLFKNKKKEYEELKETLSIYYNSQFEISHTIKGLNNNDYYDVIIEEYDIYNCTGSFVVNKVQDTIQKLGLNNPAYIDNVITVIQKNINQLNDLKKSFEQIINVMTEMRKIQYHNYKNKNKEDLVLEITIQKNIYKMTELKKHLEKWDKIITTFKRLSGEKSPDDNNYYSVNDGSLIMAIGLVPVVALPILKCVTECYNIKIKQETYKREVQRTELFSQISERLKSELENELKPNLDLNEIVEKLLTESFNPESTENKNEIETLLKRAVKEIYDFICNEGEIGLLDESKEELNLDDVKIKEKDLLNERVKELEIKREQIEEINKREIPLLLEETSDEMNC